ncbi:MAG: hypothetical protein GY704_10310 [Phycisphaeraceae bacterium]|nr:hypothetical protein [Phycisphaeraceae bacterium]
MSGYLDPHRTVELTVAIMAGADRDEVVETEAEGETWDALAEEITEARAAGYVVDLPAI